MSRGYGSDTGPVTIIPEWVLYHPDVSAQALRLYAVLGRHADSDLKARPGRRRLAELCGVSMKSVDRFIGELVSAGALEVEPRYDDAGDRTTNGYTVIRADPSRGGVRDVPTGGDTGGATGGDTEVPGTMALRNEGHGNDVNPPAAPESKPYDPLVGQRIDKHDLVWDALASVIETDEPPHGSRMRLATKQIRATLWEYYVRTRGAVDLETLDPATTERMLAESVVHVANRIKSRHVGLTWGPEGIARHFRAGLTAADTVRSTQTIVEEATRHASAS